MASHWEGVRLPRASGKSPDFPEVPRTSPEVFGDFPGSSLTVELNSIPEVPRKFPRLPRKFPELPRKFPGLPRRSAVSLGSLTPSSDSQTPSLTSDRLTNVIVSEIFAKLIPLGILSVIVIRRVFPGNCYNSRESILLGIKRCNCECNHRKITVNPESKSIIIPKTFLVEIEMTYFKK